MDSEEFEKIMGSMSRDEKIACLDYMTGWLSSQLEDGIKTATLEDAFYKGINHVRSSAQECE